VSAFECVACGRRITNDDRESNVAHWTLDAFAIGNRLAYCGDSDDCERDAYRQLGIEVTS
jgi:hypothetical protein